MDVILESVPIDIPNVKKCRANHGLGASVPFEDERQKILNDILYDLQTQRLRDTRERIKKVKNLLVTEYELLEFNKEMLKKSGGDECWATFISETLGRIEGIVNDYSNYIQGGYGCIPYYLSLQEGSGEEEEEID